MPLLFRQIKNRLAWERPESATWLPADDIQADVLSSFQTSNNALSIYVVDDSQLDRLVAACSANRENVQTFDYVVVEKAYVEGLGLAVTEVLGELPDHEANLWHRDLTCLTARQVIELGIRMQSRGRVIRRLDKEIGKLLNISLAAHHLDRSKMKQSLLADLAKPKYTP